MKYLQTLLFTPAFLIGTVGAFITLNKLERMKQIRGFKPGAIIQVETVHAKWLQAPDTWWISWTPEDIQVPGKHRMNLPKEVWDRYEVGEAIEVVKVRPNGLPFHREGIYACDSNFVLDYCLLLFEFGLILYALPGVNGRGRLRYRLRQRWQRFRGFPHQAA